MGPHAQVVQLRNVTVCTKAGKPEQFRKNVYLPSMDYKYTISIRLNYHRNIYQGNLPVLSDTEMKGQLELWSRLKELCHDILSHFIDDLNHG